MGRAAHGPAFFVMPGPPIFPFLIYNHRMESDSYYMGTALAQARKGLAAGEVPVGAVLVDEAGEIMARAFNQPIGLNDPTAHAEILALREGARLRGNYRLPGVSLYVTMEPCIMCLGALLAARVRRVVFGAPDPKGGACVSLYRLPEDDRLNHRLEVTGGVREAECRQLLQQFFQARR
jgi:tRNA(adenine34) deaminase